MSDRILLMPTVEKVLKQKELFQISFVLHHRYFNLALFFELHLAWIENKPEPININDANVSLQNKTLQSFTDVKNRLKTDM